MGLMVAGLNISGDIFFIGLHLIGEKLNRDYRKRLKKEIQGSKLKTFFALTDGTIGK